MSATYGTGNISIKDVICKKFKYEICFKGKTIRLVNMQFCRKYLMYTKTVCHV